MKLENLVLNTVEPGQSLPSLIANVLRSAIVNGVLKPGEPLRQDDLAAHFKVSHIPVREALRQLEIEGLAISQRNRGVVVTTLSPKEVEEIFEIRSLLEAEALRLAIPNYTSVILQRAAQILDEIDQEQDISQWGELNSAFHTTLYTPADRPRLLSMIATLHRNGDRYVRMKLSVLKCKDRAQQEHRQILAACQDGNVELAVTLLNQHIVSAGRELVTYLKHEPS
jgi:DNA-binding GntR family transcriptional regulator